MKPMMFAGLLAVGLLAASPPAGAQTPPSPSEIAAYTGLLGVTQSGALNEIKQLLVNGLDPNGRDGHGRTPYLVAAHRGDIAAMEMLVQGGADPKAKDSRNYDAITILAVADRVEAMKAAIRLGGDPKAITSPYQGTALIAAAHLGHHEVVKGADRRRRAARPCQQPRLDGADRVDRAGRWRLEPPALPPPPAGRRRQSQPRRQERNDTPAVGAGQGISRHGGHDPREGRQLDVSAGRTPP